MPVYRFKCPLCEKEFDHYRTLDDTITPQSPCCHLTAVRVWTPPFISIPSDAALAKRRIEKMSYAEAEVEQKEMDANRREVKKLDEQFQRDWYRAELHGPTDGGQALKDEMAAEGITAP